MSIPVIENMKVRNKGETTYAKEIKLADGEIALIFRPNLFGPDIVSTVEESTSQLVMPDAIEGSPFIMAAMVSMLFYGGPNCQDTRHYALDQVIQVMTKKGFARELTADAGSKH